MRSVVESLDPIEVGALALQRVLALEGRNALARVELAASELVRFEASPAVRDRISAIREAVEELDAVLDKIERLSDPQRGTASGLSSDLSQVFAALAKRIAPSLAARGVVLEPAEIAGGSPVALSAPVLERLLLGFVRVVVAALEDSGTETDGDPIVLSVCCAEGESAIELFASAASATGPRRLRIARAARVELEVALAEWGIELVDETGATPCRLGLRLHASVSDV